MYEKCTYKFPSPIKNINMHKKKLSYLSLVSPSLEVRLGHSRAVEGHHAKTALGHNALGDDRCRQRPVIHLDPLVGIPNINGPLDSLAPERSLLPVLAESSAAPGCEASPEAFTGIPSAAPRTTTKSRRAPRPETSSAAARAPSPAAGGSGWTAATAGGAMESETGRHPTGRKAASSAISETRSTAAAAHSRSGAPHEKTAHGRSKRAPRWSERTAPRRPHKTKGSPKRTARNPEGTTGRSKRARWPEPAPWRSKTSALRSKTVNIVREGVVVGTISISAVSSSVRVPVLIHDNLKSTKKTLK
jgi:hypothetical protein